MARTPVAVIPRDMLLQPEFYRGMRNYRDALHVVIVTAPEVLLDFAIPLAMRFVQDAVLAWVPYRYLDASNRPLAAYLQSLGGNERVSVVCCDGDHASLWLCLFTSSEVKLRMTSSGAT